MIDPHTKKFIIDFFNIINGGDYGKVKHLVTPDFIFKTNNTGLLDINETLKMSRIFKHSNNYSIELIEKINSNTYKTSGTLEVLNFREKLFVTTPMVSIITFKNNRIHSIENSFTVSEEENTVIKRIRQITIDESNLNWTSRMDL